jgi:hypothetical protein
MLTIGIPTFNRPDMLPTAIRSALNQTVAVKVIVTDNGDSSPTEEILSAPEFASVRYIKTNQKGAWPNWRAAAQACTTDYFAWLQDDDVIRGNDPENPGTYAERIVDAMDYFPDCNVWMARLQCAYTAELGMPGDGNYPHIPMDMLNGKPARWAAAGDVFIPSCYVTAWSLSPAQAFRVNDRFFEALQAMPEGAEMMIERLFPAYLSLGRPMVFDPTVAGYWVQHTRMLHLAQNMDAAEGVRQQTRALRCLDLMMDDIESRAVDWRAMLGNWVKWIRLSRLEEWAKNAKDTHRGVERGPYIDQVISIISKPVDDLKRLMPKRDDWVADMFSLPQEPANASAPA